MKNLEFSDKDIKSFYRSVVKDVPAIEEVIKFNLYDEEEKIKILGMFTALMQTHIVIKKNDEIYGITYDHKTKKIVLSSKVLPYKAIYNSYKSENIVPIGYEYQNDKRVILREKLCSYANNYILLISENSKKFKIDLCGGNTGFKIEDFIQKILNYDLEITDVLSLLSVVSSLINLDYFYVKINDEQGNMVAVRNNVLDDYIEYRDLEDESQTIYLKNNEFVLEKRIKEKYEDDITPFMKKIGVYNGKEERKN